MNSNVLPFVLLLVFAAFLTVWGSKDLPLSSLVAIVCVFSIAEVLTNYPLVWRDVYLHGSATKGIIDQGHVADTSWSYPKTNPGFFLFWAIFSLVTGLDLIPSNLLVLLPVTITLMVIMLVVFYRRLSIRLPCVATLLAFLLMNFNTNEFTFFHLNTRLLSLVYVLLFLLLFLGKSERKSVIGLLVISFALVVTHPMNSWIPVAFLMIYWLLERKTSRFRLYLPLTCAIVNAAWLVYVESSLLATGLISFLNFQYAISTVQGWSPALAKPMPLYGNFLGSYYKILILTLTLISLYAAIKLRKETRIRILSYYLLSVMLVYGLSFLSALKDISVNRGIIAGSVAVASLSVVLLIGAKSNAQKQWRRYTVIGAVVVLVVPHFVFAHEQPLSRYGRVGSISSTCYFILNHRNGQNLVSLGDFPIYYCYYEPFYTGYVNLGFKGWTTLGNITDFLIKSPDPSLKILDYRKIIDWGAVLSHANTYDEALEQWKEEVYPKIDSFYARIYSNGFETLYR